MQHINNDFCHLIENYHRNLGTDTISTLSELQMTATPNT